VRGQGEHGDGQGPGNAAELVGANPRPARRGAWADFVALYAPLVYGLARRHGLQDADAADLSQDVLRTVVQAAPRFAYDPARGSFRGWLFTVARNRIRRRALEGKRELPCEGSPEALEEQPAPAEEGAEWDREYQEHLWHWAAEKVRGSFREATWQAFWRTAVEGRSPQEVAAELGLSPGAVYIARSRVLARLREQVRQVERDDSQTGEVSDDRNQGVPPPEVFVALLNNSLSDSAEERLTEHVGAARTVNRRWTRWRRRRRSPWSARPGAPPWKTPCASCKRRYAISKSGRGPSRVKRGRMSSRVGTSLPGWGATRYAGVIGRGGMGVVLEAFDPTLERLVAIKVLAPQLASSAAARQRFAREARAVAAISHEHVVAIHEVNEADGPALPRDGTRGRAVVAGMARPRGALAVARSAAHRRAGGPGAVGGAPERACPSRRQAGQHSAVV